MKLQLHFQHSNLPLLIQLKHKSPLKNPRFPYGKGEIYQLVEKRSIVKPLAQQILPKSKKFSRTEISKKRSNLWCTPSSDPAHSESFSTLNCPFEISESVECSRTEISKKRSSLWFGPSPDTMHSGSFSAPTEIYKKRSNLLVVGAVSVGVVLFLLGFDDKNQALALGPEGPLMEEFWDNMRRYGLYALTVSTGVLWAVFQPIYELLKNPISAILILTIMGGSVYIVSQVVSAMVGVTDFSYDYNY